MQKPADGRPGWLQENGTLMGPGALTWQWLFGDRSMRKQAMEIQLFEKHLRYSMRQKTSAGEAAGSLNFRVSYPP